jgi:ATP-dependent protease HslVU (ClpYQ) peptidase subunit
MTAIVGLVEDGKVWLGGDSAAVADSFTMSRKDPKVFRNGEFIFGFTSSFRMGDLLQHSLQIPEPHEDGYTREYMCTDFIDEVRACFMAGGVAGLEGSVESGGNFLVGVADKLYEISDDYQVGEYINDFICIGCGDNHAMGALYAIQQVAGDITRKNLVLTPKDKIQLALEAAAEFSGWVKEPFHIIHT